MRRDCKSSLGTQCVVIWRREQVEGGGVILLCGCVVRGICWFEGGKEKNVPPRIQDIWQRTPMKF